MPNDKAISHLISQSMRRKLDDEESARVDSHLRESEEARKFAELSALIQTSVSGTSLVESSGDQNGLSQEAKARLKESIRGAVQQKASLSQADSAGSISASDSGSGRLHDPQLAETSPVQKEVGQSLYQGHENRQAAASFRLVRPIAEGGLGKVWLAQDEKLGRAVAIKQLKSQSLESPQAWQRFHREAEITGHLEHPNVVPLYFYGVDRQSGEPFYAMRFVGKRTLSDAIEEHHDRVEADEECCVSVHRLLSIFQDICQAIAYAHSRGVVHRDLKPDNVVLDNFGQVIVIDWGLAKVLEDGELATKLTSDALLSESDLLQTMQGEAIGTPLYMSPEQAAGELNKIDHRTDVYGLGAILFSILTGKAPHEKSVVGTPPDYSSDLNSVLKIIAASDPPTASDYGKSVPRKLENICVKAMARKQHMRFDSAVDLASAVESWMAGQSGKQAAYDALRMEGRELRADMQATVRDMARNIRFAAGMPSIEGLMKAESDEDKQVWRKRLATVFQGLLKATPYFRSFVYIAVGDGQFTEQVRAERHSSDMSTIRVVPRSHLRSGQISEFVQRVADEMPEEVYTSVVIDPYGDSQEGCATDLRLVSGVPVYDSETEDVSGCVMIECEINQLLRDQLSRGSSAAEVVVACNATNRVLLQSRSGQIIDTGQIETVEQIADHFLTAVETLQTEADFIDGQDSAIFGATLWFVPNERGISYLLRRK
ncbi:serine/threonine-protein kinase [Planctomycetes bacterium K23_9]|uniref:Serine/threonine-protein kinase PknD n=1 Tax=Stieleria marina TaxID=1930275 RepID=A0A517NUP0_9BACT|nr:Serine/threonine-protein kinase PknD [Planctomycetes bacterium K23_9]